MDVDEIQVAGEGHEWYGFRWRGLCELIFVIGLDCSLFMKEGLFVELGLR